MARLVIVTHEFDDFECWRLMPWPRRESRYTLFDVLRHFETLGHSWRVTKGPNFIPGDAALLHVDSTLVADEYLALRSSYARTINFGTRDISKRHVSGLKLSSGDRWSERVIVKSDLNFRGIIEDMHNRRAERAGRPLPHPGVEITGRYQVLNRMEDVAAEIWDDPALIVERFMPEVDEQGGYVIRTWMFMGARERCTRMVTPGWIAKASDVLRCETGQPVPDQLRDERERLNFDFGKFDFVMHDGAPILLDANRTPGVAKPIEPLMKAGARNLAEGLDELVRGVAG